MKELILRLSQIQSELRSIEGGVIVSYGQSAEAREIIQSERWKKNIEAHDQKFGPIPKDLVDILVYGIGKFRLDWRLSFFEDEAIWLVGSNLDCGGIRYAIMELEDSGDSERMVGGPIYKEWEYRQSLVQHQGFQFFGLLNTRFLPILIKFNGDTHDLFLYLNDCRPPTKLFVKLEEFLELAMQVRGMFGFALYLTEEFPAQMEAFRYTGFFEKVEKLFPGTDLSRFRHRERCDFQESTVLRDGKLQYEQRIKDAFAKMPSGTEFQRWHPEADVLVFPDSPLSLWYWQLLYGIKFSDAFESFYTANQKLEVCWSVDGNVKGRFEFPRLQTELFPKGHAPEYYKISSEDAPHLVGKYVFYSDLYNDMLVQFEGDGLCSFHLLYLEADDYATHHITDDFDWLFQQLLNTRGMYWWNYFLVFKPSKGDPRYATFYQQMRAYFPDADMSLYPEPEGL
jgi:hypothetical protein